MIMSGSFPSCSLLAFTRSLVFLPKMQLNCNIGIKTVNRSFEEPLLPWRTDIRPTSTPPRGLLLGCSDKINTKSQETVSLVMSGFLWYFPYRQGNSESLDIFHHILQYRKIFLPLEIETPDR